MKTTQLSKNFNMYTFDPDEGRVLGQNIFVLFHENECVIFDAGYERHMSQLLPHLEGYTIKYVICTHFHPDHTYGLNVMPKQHVIGSFEAINTLTMFEVQDNELLVPQTLVKDSLQLTFHNHTIKLQTNPGHSNCGLLIDVDQSFVLIGDEYMTTNLNEPVLPYVAETITQHIQALECIINNYKTHTFIPSHGVPTTNVDDLEYRVRYLEYALTKNSSLEPFYQQNDTHFLSESWHRLNIRKNN